MKKLLFGFLMLSFLFLSSCGTVAVNSEKSALNTVPPKSTVEASDETNSILQFDSLGISSIMFKEAASGQAREYSITNLISEFKSLLANQTYRGAETEWDTCYKAELLDNDNNVLVNISFGARSVTFDNYVNVGGVILEKGATYETEEWLYDYLREFFKGFVLNPVHIAFPARLEIPGGEFTVEMIDRGSNRINQYDTFSRLNDFIEKYISGKEFEITDSDRFYNYKPKQDEELRQKENPCLVLNYNTSETYMDINSLNEYEESVKAFVLIIYKSAEKPDEYKLVADAIAFYIKVDSAFDEAFGKLFSYERETQIKLTPVEITTLFKDKKPYYMDYISKNLGMTGWDEREDNQLAEKRMKLNTGSLYTVLCFSNPYSLRLLIFKYDKEWIFTGYVDFGGRQAGTAFEIEKAGEQIWIAGNRCLGHGTGVNIYNREWYTVTDKGVSLALSIPFDAYEVGPYVGYIFKAEDIKLKNGSTANLSVDYDLTRVYVLDIDAADEYGQVNVKGRKSVEFTWDDNQARFVSDFSIDSAGPTFIPPECDEITKKCGELLETNYDRLSANIKNLSKLDNGDMKRYKAQALKEFLDDCPDSIKKAALLKLLKDNYSDFIN